MTQEEATLADETRKLQFKAARLAREKQKAEIKGRGRGCQGASQAESSRGSDFADRGRSMGKSAPSERARSVSSALFTPPEKVIQRMTEAATIKRNKAAEEEMARIGQPPIDWQAQFAAEVIPQTHLGQLLGV